MPPEHEPDGIAIPAVGSIADPRQAGAANEVEVPFLERGGADGRDVEDRLQAEQFLRERRSIACDLGLDLDL